MVEKIKFFHRWWRTWKTFPVLSWVRGAYFYSQGKFEDAATYYERGLEKYSSHPAQNCARLDLAYCYFKTGKIAEAEKQLKYVTTKAPKSREGFIRLAKLQLWTGRALEAAWTMRRSMRSVKPDADLVSMFLNAVLDNGGPDYLIGEALRASKALSEEQQETPVLTAALAKYDILRGDKARGRLNIERIASEKDAPLEAVLTFASALLEEGKIAQARHELRRALAFSPHHPYILSLLSVSYLKSGPFYNPDYACQLATDACKQSHWLSPREMHTLAEAFYHTGDKISALLIASKAKQAGTRLLGEYRDVRNLERLIEDLSTGTQA